MSERSLPDQPPTTGDPGPEAVTEAAGPADETDAALARRAQILAT